MKNMDESEDDDKSVNVSLYDSVDEKQEDHLKKNESIFDDDKIENFGIYDKETEEIFIATSPSFAEVNDKASIEEMYSQSHHNSKLFEKSRKDCVLASKVETDFVSDVSKVDSMDDYSMKSTNNSSVNVVGQNYFVSSDISQIGNLGTEVSKTFYYVLSPMGTVNSLIRSPSEEVLNQIETGNIVCTSDDSKSLDSDEILPRMSEKKDRHVLLDNKKGCCLNDLDPEAEHIDLVQTEIATEQAAATDFTYNVNFINGIPDHHNDNHAKVHPPLWHSISTTERDQEKRTDQHHSLLMKYDHNAKIELPMINGQPYLQVALVNDMDSATAGEIVSTDQILGVAIPEIFTCKWENCGAHFLTHEGLVKHVNFSHINVDRTLRYHCHWKDCVREGKPFDARYKMLIHLRTHTGEKPHVCPVDCCEAAFSRIENLKIHVRTHTGEKPYACQYEGCGKLFANSSDRFKHKRTHAEKKPYRCTISGCTKSYTDPSSLRKHRKRHSFIELKKLKV